MRRGLRDGGPQRPRRRAVHRLPGVRRGPARGDPAARPGAPLPRHRQLRRDSRLLPGRPRVHAQRPRGRLDHLLPRRGPLPPQRGDLAQPRRGHLRGAPVLRDEELRPRHADAGPCAVQGLADRLGPGQPLGVHVDRVLPARPEARAALRAVRPAPGLHRRRSTRPTGRGSCRPIRATSTCGGPPPTTGAGSERPARAAGPGGPAVLCATPAPHGAERPAAEAFARWARAAVPGVRWEVAGVGADGANVVGTVDGTGPKRTGRRCFSCRTWTRRCPGPRTRTSR